MMVGRTLDLIDGVGAPTMSLGWDSAAYSARDQSSDRLGSFVFGKTCLHTSAGHGVSRTSSRFAHLCGVRKSVGVVGAGHPVLWGVLICLRVHHGSKSSSDEGLPSCRSVLGRAATNFFQATKGDSAFLQYLGTMRCRYSRESKE